MCSHLLYNNTTTIYTQPAYHALNNVPCDAYRSELSVPTIERLRMANYNPHDLLIAPRTVLKSTDQDKYQAIDQDQAAIYYIIVGAVI